MVRTAPRPLLAISAAQQERELRRSREREEGERLVARAVRLALLIFAAWQLIGATLVLMSSHTTSERIGQAWMAGAFAVGYGGAFFHLIIFYLRGRARDDW